MGVRNMGDKELPPQAPAEDHVPDPCVPGHSCSNEHQRKAQGSDGRHKRLLVYQVKPRENQSCLALYSENICFPFFPRAQHLPSLLMSAWIGAL